MRARGARSPAWVRGLVAAGVAVWAGLIPACGDDDTGSTEGTSTGHTATTTPETTGAEVTTGMTSGPTWDRGIAAIFETRCANCHPWTLDYDLVTAETEYLRHKIELGHGNLTAEELVEVGLWFDNGTPR